jgi:mediator of RNA polymerase II transcription subunit 18, fungi type
MQNSYKNEAIEESYQFFRDQVEFCLFRHYALPTANPTQPSTSLPPWNTLSPGDPMKRWLLVVKAHVVQDNKPDEVIKAQDQLMAVRNELEGVFDFKVFDRKVHDTRVAMEVRTMPAPLPQVVTVGTRG